MWYTLEQVEHSTESFGIAEMEQTQQ
jgi:hypothetical protein